MTAQNLFDAYYQTQRNIFSFPGQVFTFKGAFKTGDDLILHEDGTAAHYSMFTGEPTSPVFSTIEEIEVYRLANGNDEPCNQRYMD